jgi:hypothetical protein
MAYVSGGNLAGTEPQLGEITKEAETSDDFFQSPSFHVGNHKPTLGEYEYYANLKREAERNGSSGNGLVSSSILVLVIIADTPSQH